MDEVGIYDQNVAPPAMEVLKFYADQGLVDLRKSNYIPEGHKQYLLHGSPVSFFLFIRVFTKKHCFYKVEKFFFLLPV